MSGTNPVNEDQNNTSTEDKTPEQQAQEREAERQAQEQNADKNGQETGGKNGNEADAEVDATRLNPNDYAYYSERDIDGDGKTDLIYTTDDEGFSEVHHVNEHGEVTLTDVDLDGDGTMESSYQELKDGSVKFYSDTDGNGESDTVTYMDGETGGLIQQDVIEDGQVVSRSLDSDGDGNPEVQLVDTDGDGTFDTAYLDTDNDGVVNTEMVDTDGDGQFDRADSDLDGDGVLETRTDAFDSNLDSFGSIDSFEQMAQYEEMNYETTDGGFDAADDDAGLSGDDGSAGL